MPHGEAPLISCLKINFQSQDLTKNGSSKVKIRGDSSQWQFYVEVGPFIWKKKIHFEKCAAAEVKFLLKTIRCQMINVCIRPLLFKALLPVILI